MIDVEPMLDRLWSIILSAEFFTSLDHSSNQFCFRCFEHHDPNIIDGHLLEKVFERSGLLDRTGESIEQESLGDPRICLKHFTNQADDDLIRYESARLHITLCSYAELGACGNGSTE